MGLYTDTDIYLAAEELMHLVVKHLRSLPRDYQVSLGYDARRAARGVVITVYRANSAWNEAKVPHYKELLELLEDLKLTLRICVKLLLISEDQNAEEMHMIERVGKQATALRNTFAGAPAR